jgi:RHS repeat-associated protein
VSGTTRTGELRYRPFGVTRFASGTTPTSYRFTGQREEAALGLYYYNARWYDPALGHFLSPDALVPETGNALDYHRYAYVRFNPLKYTDPTGHYSVEELMQHFGVDSFEALMALFGESGPYAGNSGWYDILRAAQDGDRITATLPDYQTSISGSFVRTREGRILIDMGYSHLVPEAEFARFGGRWADAASHGWPSEYGMYRLQGANGERWATAASGSQMLNDIPCNTWDCVAIGIDLMAVGYAYTSEAAFWSTPVTTIGGAAGFTYGKFAQVGAATAGVVWAEYQYSRGKASSVDLWVARATAAAGFIPTPIVGPVAATSQLLWDILDPIHPW